MERSEVLKHIQEAKRPMNQGTYTGYSVGTAVVWAGILAAARRRLEPDDWRALQRLAGAWWGGWLSATIARAGYPPAKELTPRGRTALERVSLVLVAAGFLGAGRLLVRGRLPRVAARGGSELA